MKFLVDISAKIKDLPFLNLKENSDEPKEVELSNDGGKLKKDSKFKKLKKEESKTNPKTLKKEKED